MATTPKKKSITKTKHREASDYSGAFTAYKTAWERMRSSPRPLLLFVGVYTLLGVVSALSQGGRPYWHEDYMPYESLAVLLFLLALPIYGLALADNRKLSIDQFMQFDLRKYLAMLAVGILTVLIWGVSILLLIVPIIWTLAWFVLAIFPVVDKSAGPIEALKQSKRLSERHKAKVWGIVGVSVLLYLPMGMIAVIPYVGVAALGLLTVWTMVAQAILYRWLQEAAN